MPSYIYQPDIGSSPKEDPEHMNTEKHKDLEETRKKLSLRVRASSGNEQSKCRIVWYVMGERERPLRMTEGGLWETRI